MSHGCHGRLDPPVEDECCVNPAPQPYLFHKSKLAEVRAQHIVKYRTTARINGFKRSKQVTCNNCSRSFYSCCSASHEVKLYPFGKVQEHFCRRNHDFACIADVFRCRTVLSATPLRHLRRQSILLPRKLAVHPRSFSSSPNLPQLPLFSVARKF